MDQFVPEGLTLDQTVALACPGEDQAVGDACWGFEDEDMMAGEAMKHTLFNDYIASLKN